MTMTNDDDETEPVCGACGKPIQGDEERESMHSIYLQDWHADCCPECSQGRPCWAD